MELAIVLKEDAENPDVGDMLLVKGTAVLRTELGEEVAQRLTVAFNFFKGEWFLDLRAGLPWFEAIFTKGGQRAARSVFTKVILGCEGVAALDRLDIQFDKKTRKLDVAFVARLADRSTFDSKVYGPFVVSI